MTKLDPRRIPPDQMVLVHDPNDGDWTLYRHIEGSTDEFLVAWDGRVPETPMLSSKPWSKAEMTCYHFHAVTREQADACEMFARHLAGGKDLETRAERWYDFAKRIASAGVAEPPAQAGGEAHQK